MGGIGHLLGAGGYLFGTFPNLAHGFVQLGLNAVQRDLDGHKVSHIFLPGGGSQIPSGNGVQDRSDLADVGPEALDRSFKNEGQLADLIIGVDGDAALFSAGQAQVALLQVGGHPGDLSQRRRDGLFQIPREEKDTKDNDAKAHQSGPNDRHKNLVVGLRGGNTGKNEAVDRSGGVPGGDIGA